MSTKVYSKATAEVKIEDILKLYYMITFELDTIKPSSFKQLFKTGENIDIASFVEKFQRKLLTAVNTSTKKELTLRTGLRYTKPAWDDFLKNVMEELGYER